MGKNNTNAEVSDQVRIRINVLSLLADVLDSAMRDTRCYLKASGKDLRFEDKRNYNSAIAGLQKFIGNKTVEKSEGVAMVRDKCDEADQIYLFILTLVDRVGENDELLFRFYDYVRSFPPQAGLEGLTFMEKFAFEKMFTKNRRQGK
ncbi:MAG: hypothetical protein IJM04_04145 [Prevotella sp.]|nr:hypothetical protein [Prevotella sp.]